MELRIWNQVSFDHRSYERKFKQLRIEARKSRDFRPRDTGAYNARREDWIIRIG